MHNLFWFQNVNKNVITDCIVMLEKIEMLNTRVIDYLNNEIWEFKC